MGGVKLRFNEAFFRKKKCQKKCVETGAKLHVIELLTSRNVAI